MDIGQFALTVAGSTLLGVGLGQVGMVIMPDFGATAEDVDKSPALALGKQAIQVMANAGLDIYMLYRLSEYLLPGGNDPTNGAYALAVLLHSDVKLMHDIKKLGRMVHTYTLGGTGVGSDFVAFISKQGKDLEQLLSNKLSSMADEAEKNVDLVPTK